jgi:4-oxalomesaconate hydratase
LKKKRAAMDVMGAQGYLREYYSQRASQRANHARRICGDKEIKFAEAFQRITRRFSEDSKLMKVSCFMRCH